MSKDTIYRQTAIDKLRRRKALFCKNQIEFKLLPTNDKSRVDEIDACIAMLINMLPEDVQPVVHGKWIDAEWEHINSGEKRKGRRCSVCGCGYFRYDVSVNTVSDIPNYCPNCGAKMDEEGADNVLDQ